MVVGQVEQSYIKSKCGHSILLDKVNSWTQCVGNSNIHETEICWTHCILNICLILLSSV